MEGGNRGLIGLDEVVAAAERLRGVIRPTPVTRADAIGKVVGRTLLLKPEQLQRAGSFKIRGAYNRISGLPRGTAVVAASAGNHAQGVALAASLTGATSTIFMPASAPLPKVQATRDYGAEIRLVDGVVDDAIAAARAHAAETGAVLVHPFDDPLIIAGQGTVGLELLDEATDAEVVLVPIGGGGLISGVATAVHGHVRVIGVEAAGAAKVGRSLELGAPVRLDSVATMADGIAVKSPSALTLAHIDALVDDVITVTEEEISQAVVLLLERAKAVVEPAGAVGVAALLAGKVAGTGAVVSVLSGGNVDPLLLTKLIEHGLSAAGRYLVLRVVVADRPGALAALTAAVATMGLNVLSVDHHRAGLELAVDEVEVLLTLETRDPAHRDEVVSDLRGQGYRVDLVR
ncbi:MAG TPA: threonine ammonia-lyase [Acidimicrobiales bacterium]|nr:threonine ammonia-lyase [Acidimicrobiales bacterium]